MAYRAATTGSDRPRITSSLRGQSAMFRSRRLRSAMKGEHFRALRGQSAMFRSRRSSISDENAHSTGVSFDLNSFVLVDGSVATDVSCPVTHWFYWRAVQLLSHSGTSGHSGLSPKLEDPGGKELLTAPPATQTQTSTPPPPPTDPQSPSP